MRFEGSEQYVATRDLTLAVNAAITLVFYLEQTVSERVKLY